MHDSGSNIFKNGLIFRSFSIQISQQNPIIVWKTGSNGINKLKTDLKSRDTVSQDWTQKIVGFLENRWRIRPYFENPWAGAGFENPRIDAGFWKVQSWSRIFKIPELEPDFENH